MQVFFINILKKYINSLRKDSHLYLIMTFQLGNQDAQRTLTQFYPK